jgi:DNA-binding LacI/PurR family transcriptional regulator
MGVTIHDIARESKVSIAAVSKALNDRQGVSEELRTRIKAIAERLQYAPYIKSREHGMLAHNVKEIAVIYDRPGGHLFDEIQGGVDTALSSSGYRELRFTIGLHEMFQESTKKLFLDKILNDPYISGAIFVFIPLTDGDIALFKRKNIQVVQLNIESDFGQCVAIDNFSAAYDATKKFIELGHKSIGFVLPNDWVNQVWRDRLAGYKKALVDHGLSYDGGSIGNESTFVPKEAGYVTRELILNNPSMTAILYASDLQAMGGLKMLREMHMRVPEDIAVIGFDDMKMSELFDPPIASVHQPMYEMGKLGTEMLLDAIKNETFTNQKKILKSQLIVRRSCDLRAIPSNWIAPTEEKSK